MLNPYLSDVTVDAILEELPHVRISSPCGTPPGDVPLYSPDGRYYARLSTGTFAHVQIYSRDGALVADAWKDGWAPLLMGWAHDSSGVYFRTMIVGGAASVLAPYEPIFKLSPLTPEEERAALMWRTAAWVAVIGAALGVAWWLRQRTRRTYRGN